MRHIHILGIAGSFMASLAIIAKQLGYRVTGQDNNAHPPMSEQLAQQQIDIDLNYNPQTLPKADLFVIGNALSRGNACVEAILNQGARYTSGAQFLSDVILTDRWVLAVAGTHGKTTTAAMLAWILEYNGKNPGFLIGGVAQNFNGSACVGQAPFFVIEADEYDSAFFDKRAKFVHFKPTTLVINNIEFDHADIFSNLGDIQKQFHHLIRTVRQKGLIIVAKDDANIEAVLQQGCWSGLTRFDQPPPSVSDSHWPVVFDGRRYGDINWSMIGEHNKQNALAALLAAEHAGIAIERGIDALNQFSGVKRRLEVVGRINNTIIYDDFAHHPTAIAATLAGLKNKAIKERLIAVLELRSNTMKMGVHKDALAGALADADQAFILNSEQTNWDVQSLAKNNIVVLDSVQQIIDRISQINSHQPHHIAVMSNGDFANIQTRLLDALIHNK